MAPPTGKGRPRFKPGGGRPFTPPKTVAGEYAVRAAWDAAGGFRFPDRAPLKARIVCVVERSASHIGTRVPLTAAGLKAGEHFPHKKPDVDNVAKLVLDALEGYAYAADVAIVDLHVTKVWGSPARMIVRLEEAVPA